MRGKKPKERKNYILRTENGTLVEVTREVYLEWYQSRRREKYQQEQGTELFLPLHVPGQQKQEAQQNGDQS